MAFLDNSGDIILDAVLTDTGRFRLAKGDGSFKIVKFALSDDEINYGLYDKNNASGSAYYDLEILQTPVLEAFTNNTSTMNYKLLSLPRTNLLYLPIMMVNGKGSTNTDSSNQFSQNSGYVVYATDATAIAPNNTAPGAPGTMNGENLQNVQNQIRIDQGINNVALPWNATLDADLIETQYIIEIDSRLGLIVGPVGDDVAANISYIDDDNIASYYVDEQTGTGTSAYVRRITQTSGQGWPAASNAQPSSVSSTGLVIAGPQGTSLRFRIQSTLELRSSNYLFNTIGGDLTTPSDWKLTGNAKYIDTMVKITGATTGYRLSLPVRFIKSV